MKLFWDPVEGEEAFNGELGFEDDVGIDVFDDGDEEEGDRLKTFPDISIISRPYNGLYDRSVIFYTSLWSLDLLSWLQKINELKVILWLKMCFLMLSTFYLIAKRKQRYKSVVRFETGKNVGTYRKNIFSTDRGTTCETFFCIRN